METKSKFILMKNKVICKICKRECENNVGLISHITQNHGIPSKEYYDKYLKKEKEGICECGNKTKYLNISRGYSKFCSQKCSRNSNEIKEKFRQTCIKKYGVESPLQDERIKKKIKQINLERYGVENPFQSEEIKEKIKQTNLKKYGFENYAQTDEWKEIMKNGQAGYMNSFVQNPSKPQIELFNLTKEIYPSAILNYPVLNYSLDIIIPELKIAFEYDGSYWHKDKEEYDQKRQKEIEDLGWKFIRYIDKVPPIDNIINDIKILLED